MGKADSSVNIVACGQVMRDPKLHIHNFYLGGELKEYRSTLALDLTKALLLSLTSIIQLLRHLSVSAQVF
jgi:hypothetical protein